MFREKVCNKDFWDIVRNSEEYSWLREEVLKQYNQFAISEDIPVLKYSDFKLYHSTGNRNVYEEKYFARRHRLNALAILCIIYPEKEEYIIALNDTISAICDEHTWVLPAHVKKFPLTEYTTIDLFSAETGYALSEINYILKDRLDPYIVNRIKDEIENKIITPFLTTPQPWETFTHNWSAVCACSVGAAFMYQSPEQFHNVESRLASAMQCFLSSFYADGVCREGISYWEYGFGFFVYYAEMVKDFTSGRIDYFQNEKVKTIASFVQKAYLTEDVTVSFADGDTSGKIMVGLTHFLKTVYPDIIKPLTLKSSKYADHCGRWCHQIRDFVFYNHEYTTHDFDNNSVYYMPDSAWYVKKCHTYAFAAKAGNNDEPHNHNDVGSFIIAKDAQQLLCDLGCGEYTREYFSDKRYDILCNSSFGHSVPIINANGQCTGNQYSGIMSVKENSISIDIKNAYSNSSGLTKLERNFDFDKNEIVMTDNFMFKCDGNYVCRLVSLIKPQKYIETLKIGDMTIMYDFSACNVTITTDTHVTHVNPTKIPVYLIDFKPNNDAHNLTLKFKFDDTNSQK